MSHSPLPASPACLGKTDASSLAQLKSRRRAERTHTILIPFGFLLLTFMINTGRNPQTSLLGGEVFPTHIRGKSAGFAVAVAKTGAVTTAHLVPVLLADIAHGGCSTS